MDNSYSINGVPIRLTHERWYHIIENHDDLASYFYEALDTIENPDFVLRGNQGTLKATRNFGKDKWFYYHCLLHRKKTERRNHMATAIKNEEIVKTCIGLSSEITRLPVKHIWVDYDKEADVLYLSFRKPQRAKKTIELGDDILIRKDGRKIVGLTILNASIRERE